MDAGKRIHTYLQQTGRRDLTARQRRRIVKAARRQALRDEKQRSTP